MTNILPDGVLVDDEVRAALEAYGWEWQLNESGYVCIPIEVETCVFLHRWVWESFYNLSLGGL